MNYTIRKDDLQNDLLAETLQALYHCYNQLQLPLYVVGASARDIAPRLLKVGNAPRRTLDLDVAVALQNWKQYEELSHILFSRKYKTLKPLPPYGPVSGNSYSVTIQNTGYGKDDSPVLFQRRDFTHSSRFFISAVGSKRATTFPSRSTTNFV